MQATSIHTVREGVILLLRRSGHSVIEATDKWDDVYSILFAQAKPGVTHRWIIGRYTLEFTKPATTAQEVQQLEQASPALFNWLVIFASLTVITLIALAIIF